MYVPLSHELKCGRDFCAYFCRPRSFICCERGRGGGLPGSAVRYMIRAPFLFFFSRLQTCILSFSDLSKILKTPRKHISSKNKCGKGSDPVERHLFFFKELHSNFHFTGHIHRYLQSVPLSFLSFRFGKEENEYIDTCSMSPYNYLYSSLYLIYQ